MSNIQVMLYTVCVLSLVALGFALNDAYKRKNRHRKSQDLT